MPLRKTAIAVPDDLLAAVEDYTISRPPLTESVWPVR